MKYVKLYESFLNEMATSKRSDRIQVFYTPKQVLKDVEKSYSKSPQKPMLLMKNFNDLGIDSKFDVNSDFVRFEREDFLIAHTPQYVDAVLDGKDKNLRDTNSIPWTSELAETVRYTNSSLYNAIKYSLEHPETPCFSPTSGFHHAHPDRGSGFCTFAGQVIASIKLYRENGARGAYFDLDGHFGNAIEDCRDFNVDINSAVPKGFNINPQGRNGAYLDYLIKAMAQVEEAVLNKEIDYVVWCHGADSHEHDDLGGQVSTEFWIKSSEAFYTWVKSVDEKLAKIGRSPLPLTMCLFGGYRKDSYESVLSLHTKDMVLCLNILCGNKIEYKEDVKSKYKPESVYPINKVKTKNKPEPKSDDDYLSPVEIKILDFLKQQGSDDFIKRDKIPGADDYSIKYLLDDKYIETDGKGFRYNSDRK